MALLRCPEHTEVRCPTECMTIRDWRALQESYRGLWRDRRNGQAELHTLDFVRGDAGWPTERVA